MAVAAVLAVLDWAAVAARSRVWERCAKPGVLAALLAAAVTAHPHHAAVHGWLVLALAFGLIGDVALSFAPDGRPAEAGLPAIQLPAAQLAAAQLAAAQLAAAEPADAELPAAEPAVPPAQLAAVLLPIAELPLAATARPGPPAEQSSPLFVGGLSSFLLGHLCYCLAMLRFGTDRLSIGFGLVLVLLALFAFGHRVLAGAHAQGGNPLAVAVTAYIIALGSAVVLGVGTTSLWVAYGIVIFAVSDLVLATDRFVGRRPWAPLTVAISYHLAQLLLLLGLVR